MIFDHGTARSPADLSLRPSPDAARIRLSRSRLRDTPGSSRNSWAWHAAEALGATVAYPAQYARAEPSRWPQAFAHRRENAPDTIGDMRQLK